MSEPLDATGIPDPPPDRPAEEIVDAVVEPSDDPAAEPDAGESLTVETVDAVPVLAEARPLEVAHSTLPAVQAAAVAATSFVAGAATLALVRRHSARKLARSRSAPRRAVDMLPIVGSRTFIVDVHLLAKPGE